MSEMGSYEYMEETAQAWIDHDMSCPRCVRSMNLCEVGRELDRISDEAEEAYYARWEATHGC